MYFVEIAILPAILFSPKIKVATHKLWYIPLEFLEVYLID